MCKQQLLHAQQQQLATQRTCSRLEGESQEQQAPEMPCGARATRPVRADVRSEKATLQQQAQHAIKQQQARAARTFDLPRELERV